MILAARSRSLLTAMALGAAFVLLAPLAQAHANYHSSEPASGARLAVAPSEVRVRLSEPFDQAGSGLDLIDCAGDRVDEGAVRYEGGSPPSMSVDVRAGLDNGTYTLRWRAFSHVDHHVTRGSVTFAVGNATSSDCVEAPVTTTAWWNIPIKVALYVGFCLVAGGLAFVYWADPVFSPQRRRVYDRLHRAGWLSIAVATLTLVAANLLESGLGFSGYIDSDTGGLMTVRVFVAVVGAVIAWSPMRNRIAAAAFFVAAVLGNARFGHAATGGTGILVDFVHQLSVAAWLGGLATLVGALLLSARQGVPASEALAFARRYSRLALVSVIAMATSGLTLSLLILGLPRLEHVTEDYAHIVAAKIVLATMMVAVGGLNRFGMLAGASPANLLERLAARIMPTRPLAAAPDESAADAPATSLRRLVKLEASLGALVLVLASMLANLAPPTQAQENDALLLRGEGESLAAELAFRPAPVAGQASEVRLRLTHLATGESEANNSCGRDSCVRFALVFSDDAEAGEEPRVGRPAADGWWRFEPLLFSRPGNYTIDLDVQTAYVYFEEIEFEFSVQDAGQG